MPEIATLPHPFLQRLARLLLAKAERTSSQGPVRLTLDTKSAPELYVQTDAEQMQLWLMLLDDLCSTHWVAMRLNPPRDFATFTDRNPKLELLNFEALAVWAGYTPQALRWQCQWLAHLTEHWSKPGALTPANSQGVLDYLTRSPLTALEGLTLDDAARSLDALYALCLSGRKLPLREASAQAFQGRSKVLDSREELLRLMGAMPKQFQEMPIQLLVALPDMAQPFNNVLFIENLVTFERMADHRALEWADSLLVFAAGFKGSAKRLRSREGCTLFVRMSPRFRCTESAIPSLHSNNLQAAEDWLFVVSEIPVRFFGDLDYAGMQILLSLRTVFPLATAWKPGYSRLAHALETGQGHAPEQAFKELQLDPGQTGCAYMDQHLLPLLRQHQRFIDQEFLDLDNEFGLC